MLDCILKVSKFKLQSCYYIHFQTNTVTLYTLFIIVMIISLITSDGAVVEAALMTDNHPPSMLAVSCTLQLSKKQAYPFPGCYIPTSSSVYLFISLLALCLAGWFFLPGLISLSNFHTTSFFFSSQCKAVMWPKGSSYFFFCPPPPHMRCSTSYGSISPQGLHCVSKGQQ